MGVGRTGMLRAVFVLMASAAVASMACVAGADDAEHMRAADEPAVLEAHAGMPADSAGQATAKSLAVVDADDCVRIREARRLASELGDGVWAGWSGAPFSILLITDDREFLFDHPDPGSAFEAAARDDCLGGEVYVRARVFNPRLLATFPAFGTPAVVIGQPAHTQASHSTRWTMTLLHEHFHQWQQSQPDYYDAVATLGLAGDNDSGMWMLNYEFPYDDKAVNEAFDDMCHRLRAALLQPGPPTLSAFLESRAAVKDLLSEKDYAYLSFQLWQEGVARYTEWALALRASSRFDVSDAFRALPDYTSFEEDARATRKRILEQLQLMSLTQKRRTAFYHAGAAEAMLLDRVRPGWRLRYMREKFFLEKYYENE